MLTPSDQQQHQWSPGNLVLLLKVPVIFPSVKVAIPFLSFSVASCHFGLRVPKMMRNENNRTQGHLVVVLYTEISQYKLSGVQKRNCMKRGGCWIKKDWPGIRTSVAPYLFGQSTRPNPMLQTNINQHKPTLLTGCFSLTSWFASTTWHSFCQTAIIRQLPHHPLIHWNW